MSGIDTGELTETGAWLRRVRGSLVLAACADALGAPFEGTAAVDDDTVVRALTHPPETLTWTDDTALTLVLADHLARREGALDEDELAAELAQEWAADPGRGYGAGAAAVLARIRAGTPWPEAAGQLFNGAGSYGNGAAMRVAPAGLLPGLGLSAVAQLARRTAVVTHAHEFGQDGAVVQAVAVALAARPEMLPAADTPEFAHTFVETVAGYAVSASFRSALRQAGTLAQQGAPPGQVAAALGHDVTAPGSVPAAVAVFLRYPDDAWAAVRYALGVGGDADTIATMAGAMVGARVGDDALPPDWGLRLEAGDRINTVAVALARLNGVSGYA